jgi:hypothetical protein
LEVGNPTYWTTKAVENILEAQARGLNSKVSNVLLDQAITLLLLTRADHATTVQTKGKGKTKARDTTSEEDNSVPKTT